MTHSTAKAPHAKAFAHIAFVIAMLLCSVGIAHAQTSAPSPGAQIQSADTTDAEREALARIHYEIEMLKRQVTDASRTAPGATRVQFRYDWLLNDLELIGRGIQDHLDAPRQPRQIQPLKGDYRN